MTRREQAERWILSQCSETGKPVKVSLSAMNIPSGLSIRLIERTFGELISADRISGLIVKSDNAGCQIIRLRCHEK